MSTSCTPPPPRPAWDEISLRKLASLLAFMEMGNLARAAERLDTTPASMHRALHSLEEALRCPLFRPQGRQLVPTEAAHVLAQAAREVLQRLDEGIRATRRAAGHGSGRLRVGSLYSLTSRAVPTAILALKQRRPQLQAELVLGSNADLLRKLREGTIDAALMGHQPDAADLESEGLFEDEIGFAAPVGSRFASLSAVDLGACAHEPFVALTEGFVTLDAFNAAFRVAGFTPALSMRTGDIFSLMNMVQGGVGCTLLPERVRPALPPGVVMVPLQARFRVSQSIVLHFLRTRERDPDVLALLAVCRSLKAQLR